MGDDETLMCCVNQNEQPLVCSTEQYERSLSCWADQSDMTSDSAQSIDDKSSRNKNLQNVSNTLQCNDTNKSKICEEGFYPLDKRNLLNSAIGNFVGRTYTCDYKLPYEDSPFKGSIEEYNKVVPFHVEYIRSNNILSIKVPVKFMGASDVDKIVNRDPKLRSRMNSVDTTKTADIDDDFIKTYKKSVKSIWSGKYKFHLKEICSSGDYDSGSCYNWSNISPVNVDVSIDDEGEYSSYYNVFHVSRACYDAGACPKGNYNTVEYDDDGDGDKDRCCTDYYRSMTWPETVAISTETFKDAEKMQKRGGKKGRKQDGFAHEFGHQVGYGDEYAVDYRTSKIESADISVYLDHEFIDRSISDKNGFVYWNRILMVYERTGFTRQYTLSEEYALFNHQGVDYSAEEKTFNGKKGFVLLAETNERKIELDKPLPGLESPAPVVATDRDGIHYVYFYDKLKVIEEPGLRIYDLEKYYDNDAKIYHNYREYSVAKGTTTTPNEPSRVFYFLVYSSGKEKGESKNEYLDGSATSHFNMVRKEFGTDYALKNATMFKRNETVSKKDKTSINKFRENEKYIMNAGNNVEPQHYISFKKGMIEAIRSKYRSHYSPKAPNMEEDWEIKK